MAVCTPFARLSVAKTVHRTSFLVSLAVAALLSACATSPPLPSGASRDQLVQRMGPPSAEFELRNPTAVSPYLQIDTTGTAVRRLEYTGGSFGKFTHMYDFDANGRLLASAQVRTEARFNAITAGMSQDELRRALGHPSNIRGLSFQKQNVWAYRYDSPFCQWFQVGVGYDGKVVDTAYGPDPLCDDDTFSGLMSPFGRRR